MNEKTLNKQDVADLAKKPDTATKSSVARKLGRLYNGTEITPQEAALAEDIFRIMIRDTEIKVREALSETLQHCQNLPSDIVTSILNDTDSIAVPFIQYYASLTNDDLIKILNAPGLERQKAVAKRHPLSSDIADYIAEKCSDDIVGELLSNDQAEISEKSFNIIINKYSENEDIKKRIVYRSELPPSVAEKIVSKLSYRLKSYLLLHHNLPKDLVSNLVEEVKEKITLSISEDYSTDEQIEELVHQLYIANRLSSGLVVRSICLGDLKFFEYSLVYLSETPIAEVRKILFNNQADFMIRNLLRKAFIPKSVFPAIFSALKVVREIRFDCGRSNRKAFGHKVVERILSIVQNTDELSQDDIRYLISKIN